MLWFLTTFPEVKFDLCELKTWMLISEDQYSGYEPVYYSADQYTGDGR